LIPSFSKSYCVNTFPNIIETTNDEDVFDEEDERIKSVKFIISLFNHHKAYSAI
jgi:hypothetical protein